uniref:Nucleic acid binding protein n=1 Tax=Garlic virus A TaxID=12433 RepID=A0A249RNW8_9VIRU|nr:nucleic acid binding protein [Garlic virus A]ASY93171.1 nucleic acid binding protein [Garlic virus A]
MTPQDFNILCCLHFAKPFIPQDLKAHLFFTCVNECKLVRIASKNKPFLGTSKCAQRRRAKRYNRCFECGAYLLDNHKCRVFVSRAQSDVLAVIHEGPAKLHAERTYRPNSDAAQLMRSDLQYIKLFQNRKA